MNNPNAGIPYLAPAPERQGMNVQAFMQNYANLQQKTELVKATKAAQNRKAFNDYFDPNKLPKEIYGHNAKVLDRDISELSELQAQGEAAGYDVDNGRMPQEYKAKLAQQQAKINQHVTLGRENQQILEMYQKAFSDHPDKYNIQDLYKFNEGFKQVDELDPVAQNEYLRNNSPVKEDIHFVDTLTDWMGSPDTLESSNGVTVTEMEPEKLKQRLITNYFAAPPNKQQKMFENTVAISEQMGAPVKTVEEAIDFMVDRSLELAPRKETRVQPPRESAADKKEAKDALAYDYNNALSTGKWGNGWDINYSKNDEGTETVVAKKLQSDLPPMKVVGMDGATIPDFKPQKFYTLKGKLYAHGVTKDPDTEEVIEVSVPFDDNAGEFIATMDGFDPRKLLTTAAQSTQTTQTKAKSIKRSDLHKRAQDAGYTDEEYEIELKKNGIEIIGK